MLVVEGASRATVYFTGQSNYRIDPKVFVEPDPAKKPKAEKSRHAKKPKAEKSHPATGL